LRKSGSIRPTPEAALEQVQRKRTCRKPVGPRAFHFIMRLFFRGIYFPQMNKTAWIKLIAQNRKPILKLVKEAVGKYRAPGKNELQGAVAA